MSTDPKHEIQTDVAESLSPEAFEDDFETIGDYHRKAAQYFAQAATHHLAAAAADEPTYDKVPDVFRSLDTWPRRTNASRTW